MSAKRTLKPWILGQQTSYGFRYFTGKAHPTCPDAWTPDIRKAERLTKEAVANMQAYVASYTHGAPIDKVRAL